MNEKLYIDGKEVKGIGQVERFFLDGNDWKYCEIEINGQRLEMYIKKSDLEKLKKVEN